MNALIQMQGNTALVSTETIADQTGNDHRSVYRVIKSYESDFLEFGEVRFEIAGQKTTALLNEDQSALAITYLRNNKKGIWG